MNMHLKEVTHIKSGVFATRQTNPSVYYLQGNDFDDTKLIKKNVQPALKLTPSLEKHILIEDDILFLSKGRVFFAVLYKKQYAPAVASTAFLVIKASKDLVLPEFVIWFLNHSITIKNMQSLSSGSALPMISKSALENLEISLPSFEIQQKIVTIDQLQQKQNSLLERLKILKSNYLNALIYKLSQQN